MAIINTHSKSLDEILNEANNHLFPSQVLAKYMLQPYVRDYLELAVSDKWTTLDVDAVVYAKYDYDRSMAGAILLNSKTINIVQQVIMAEKVSKHAKTNQYKALMEMLYSGEAKVLRAILTKNIVDLYPTLTIDTISKALDEAV